MTPIEMLTTQTRDAYAWVNKLIDRIPTAQWDEIPEQIETTVAWQAGHLMLSYNYHTIMAIKGSPKDLYAQVPIREYSALFTQAKPVESIGKTEPDTLKEHLHLFEQRSLDTIASLSSEDLDQPLEPTRFPHPIANTKFEALDWNIKHTMWHCGQIALLSRLLNQPVQFVPKT